jgi:hypothetical protein
MTMLDGAMTMADFGDKLAALVSIETAGGKVRDPGAMSEIMERLASSLAFTVALAAQGDAKGIDHLLEGMTAYLYTTAAERAPLARMITSAVRQGQPPRARYSRVYGDDLNPARVHARKLQGGWREVEG